MLKSLHRILPSFTRSFLPSDAQAFQPVESSPPKYDPMGEALLRVADELELHPSRYWFICSSVPEAGESGCLLGLLGRQLGVPAGVSVLCVAFRHLGVASSVFYNRMNDCCPSHSSFREAWRESPAVAAETLRRYVEQYHRVVRV